MTTGDTAKQRRTTPASENRADGVLAAMIVGLIVLSVLCMIFYMIGTAGGWLTGSTAATVWFTPFLGLPIAVILMLIVTVRIAVRRSRASKRAQQE